MPLRKFFISMIGRGERSGGVGAGVARMSFDVWGCHGARRVRSRKGFRKVAAADPEGATCGCGIGVGRRGDRVRVICGKPPTETLGARLMALSVISRPLDDDAVLLLGDHEPLQAIEEVRKLEVATAEREREGLDRRNPARRRPRRLQRRCRRLAGGAKRWSAPPTTRTKPAVAVLQAAGSRCACAVGRALKLKDQRRNLVGSRDGLTESRERGVVACRTSLCWQPRSAGELRACAELELLLLSGAQLRAELGRRWCRAWG